MSCSLNRFNNERYEIRSNLPHVDQVIGNVYNPDSSLPHPPPWPLERTPFDMNMQKIWCPGCAKGSFVPTPTNPVQPPTPPDRPTQPPSPPTRQPMSSRPYNYYNRY